MDFLSGLNEQQREAVTHVDGPLLILAGAGSGKTRVITHRVAYIVTTRRAPASAVLAVTFTNKAANEMRERVAGLLDGGSLEYPPRVSTFHSFCVRLLRQDGDPLARIRPGFTRRFSIYDEDDQLASVKAAYRSLGIEEKEFMQARALLSRIGNAKNQKLGPADLYKRATSSETERIAAVFERYEQILLNANALDFDDLLLESVRLLHNDEATRETWNRRIGYVMVDEYQDTNRCQYELMRLLSESHRNVCVVGDEDQSIYSWRGADIRNILDFEHDFPNARVIRLERNYRSTKNILAAAGAVVEHNKERKGKKLWTDAGEGPRIGIYAAPDDRSEARFIAREIEEHLASHRDDHVAILYRTNAQSRQIEDALRDTGQKYAIVKGLSFYQRAEIKDVVAYLKLAMSNSDAASLLRVINTPARGIGRTTVESIERHANERKVSLWDAVSSSAEDPRLAARSQSSLLAFRGLIQEISLVAGTAAPPDLIRFILDRTGYRKMLESESTLESESRLENLDELINAAADAAARGQGLTEFLDLATLDAESDHIDERAAINLMTLHNAKGLEFPVVFVTGMEMGLFPHSRSVGSESAMEEERRLCYVGMTRARQRLILTWAKYRRRFGGGDPERSAPSGFLREVPEHLTVNLGEPEAGEIGLLAERVDVREAVRRNLFTGKTYNSLDNISQFFRDRNIPFPPRAPAGAPNAAPAAASGAPKPAAPVIPFAPPRHTGFRTGATVEHPKYGTGTVVRREGDGEDAKITVNFPRHGLKKLVEKYAGLKRT